jgi:hypothetical protein
MEMSSKLIVVVIGQNCSKFIRMCLESVQGADKIIYVDGGSNDGSINIAVGKNATILENAWNKDDPQMNGKQRNFYLKYLKDKYYVYSPAIQFRYYYHQKIRGHMEDTSYKCPQKPAELLRTLKLRRGKQ